MKKAGVLIDSYKLPVFKRHLDADGYSYTEQPGMTSGTILLTVSFNWVAELKPVIEAANAEASKGGS